MGIISIITALINSLESYRHRVSYTRPVACPRLLLTDVDLMTLDDGGSRGMLSLDEYTPTVSGKTG